MLDVEEFERIRQAAEDAPARGNFPVKVQPRVRVFKMDP